MGLSLGHIARRWRQCDGLEMVVRPWQLDNCLLTIPSVFGRSTLSLQVVPPLSLYVTLPLLDCSIISAVRGQDSVFIYSRSASFVIQHLINIDITTGSSN